MIKCFGFKLRNVSPCCTEVDDDELSLDKLLAANDPSTDKVLAAADDIMMVSSLSRRSLRSRARRF